jgi:hypothetical protein
MRGTTYKESEGAFGEGGLAVKGGKGFSFDLLKMLKKDGQK